MSTTHPHGRTEATIQLAEEYISKHSDGGLTNEAGGIMHSLIARLVEAQERHDAVVADLTQITDAEIEAAARKIDPQAWARESSWRKNPREKSLAVAKAALEAAFAVSRS